MTKSRLIKAGSDYLKILMVAVSMLASAYTFHKKIIMEDFKEIFFTKAEAEQMSASTFPQLKAIELTTDIKYLKLEVNRVHEELKETRAELRELIKR